MGLGGFGGVGGAGPKEVGPRGLRYDAGMRSGCDCWRPRGAEVKTRLEGRGGGLSGALGVQRSGGGQGASTNSSQFSCGPGRKKNRPLQRKQ